MEETAGRQQSKKRKKKIETICQKAAEVFSSKGYLSATLVDVSRASGLSKGGIYHYFSTKEELLFTILDIFTDMMLDNLEEELKTLPSPQERIRYFIRRHIVQYCNNVYTSRVVLHETNNLPAKYWTVIRKKAKKYAFILGNSIKEYLNGEKTSSDRISVLTYTLLGMCNWIYWWYDPKGPVKEDDLAEIIFTIFIGKIKDL